VPIDLAELVRPAHTALVLQECQEGVIGAESALPELAAAARREMLPNAARLARAARAAAVRVIHCTAAVRADRFGSSANARLFQHARRARVQLLLGTRAVAVVPEIGVEPADLVLTRLQGLSPFANSELDALLRHGGIRTLVLAGVSVNVAIQSLAFDAVNAAYQVVIPRDAVAGWPREYVEMVFAHTLGAVSTLTHSDALLRIWGDGALPR
jgi:nicotinamidase-related amidase